MNMRRLVASISLSTLAVGGLAPGAGAESSFSVSDTTITAGGSVRVSLHEPCLDGEGMPTYGNVISSDGDNQETKGDGFIKGSSGVFTFDEPGTYTISRFCDGWGLCSQVTITVNAPVTTTTTSTTAAPTTTVAKATETTAAPATTAPAAVLPEVVEKAAAPAAIRVVPETVSYTG